MNTSQQRIQTVCLLLLTTIASAGLLYFLQPVLVPFILALFLAIGLSPLVDMLKKQLHFPHALAAPVAILIAIVILVIAGMIVAQAAGELVENSGLYQKRLNELFNMLGDAAWLKDVGLDPANLSESLSDFAESRLQPALTTTANAVLGMVSQGALVLIFIGFIMFGQAQVPPGGTWDQIKNSTQKYILTKILTSGSTGILVYLTLEILGVDMAGVFGLLAFLLNFIPSIGSIIATLLPLPIAALSPESTWVTVVLALAIPGGIQFCIGNVLEPKIMGKNFDLHPVTVLLALIFWGTLWGIPGMFLATPLTAVSKNLLGRYEMTRPIANALAGRFTKEDASDQKLTEE